MGSCGAWPNYTAWLQNAWGAGGEFQSTWPGALFAGATNMVFGQNPPYFLDDFLAVYPKFFGLPTIVTGAVTIAGSQTVDVPSVNGLLPGQFLQGAGLQKGSVITGLGSNYITLSQPATAIASNVTLMVYESAPVPAAVIQLYINLAYASLVQARWQEQWLIAMAWFIAHYVTLYAKSDAAEVFETLVQSTHVEQAVGTVPGVAYTLSAAPPGNALALLAVNGVFLAPGSGYALNGAAITLTAPTTIAAPWATWAVQAAQFSAAQASGAQIAAQGLAGGIQTAKSVGDVSVSYQPLASLEDWGQWNLTIYGQQLATMARVIGSGPMCIY